MEAQTEDICPLDIEGVYGNTIVSSGFDGKLWVQV
jgi:hypothetical protein